MFVLFVSFVGSIAGVAVSLRLFYRLPIWSLAVMLISIREAWMLAHGTPNDRQFITPWIQTAPFVLPLILLATAEAYFRPSRHYQDSTRLALFVGGALAIISTLLILLFCLPAQAMVRWQMAKSAAITGALRSMCFRGSR